MQQSTGSQRLETVSGAFAFELVVPAFQVDAEVDGEQSPPAGNNAARIDGHRRWCTKECAGLHGTNDEEDDCHRRERHGGRPASGVRGLGRCIHASV